MSRLATAHSVALSGLVGTVVDIEVSVASGLPRTSLVGLPDSALQEAKDRCRAAVVGCGFEWPQQRVTINLTPATMPKAGSHYDLGIAGAVLAAADDRVPGRLLADRVLVGELGLDGRVRGVPGVLPALLAARDAGFTRAVVPWCHVAEAGLVEGLEVQGVASLTDLLVVLRGEPLLVPGPPVRAAAPDRAVGTSPDLADVVGQDEARHALEVAAAGGHHVFLHGAPGSGKTMLAERLPTILPDLGTDHALEVAAIRSLAGIAVGGHLDRRPPYAAPHHSASLAGLVGGGARVAQPGAASLAHRGVLFLDEAAEIAPKTLDALRTPLEQGTITLGRSGRHATYPARFQLVMAANPCPCGMSLTPGAECRCAPMSVIRYRQRLSGPILDRVDIHQTLHPVKRSLLDRVTPSESSATVLARVAEARDRQARRLADTPWRLNADVRGPYMRSCLPRADGVELVDAAVSRGHLSARGVDKVLRLAWTLADLAGRDAPARHDVRQAISLRRSGGNQPMGVAS
ncbi:YifB family Mg chelatase-like AAA ATPase [Mariniluteicoccus endophyticus]